MRVGEGDGAVVDDADVRAEEALNRFLPPDAVPGVPREHHVTALVLARDGEAWLPRALAGLAAQDRPVDQVVGVDLGSTDGSAELLEHGAGAVVRLSRDEPPGLAGALAAAVAAGDSASRAGASAGRADPVGETGGVDAIAWYWIVHDDSAPEPGCLEALLLGADRNPGAAVLVPKTVAWSDSGRLVGVGTRWAPGNPVVDPLDTVERDQGQYDVDRPVYAGDSAGLLVRADVWHALGGLDPGIGDWAGFADLCRRAWACGGEVFFIPTAVLAHRQAGLRGARAGRGSSTQARRDARAGQLLLELSQAPAWALPWRTVRAWLSTAIRMMALLVTREPEEAAAEVGGAWQVLGHPGRMRQARRRLRRPPVGDVRRPAHVRARRGAALAHSLDRWAGVSRGSAVRIWWPPPARVWQPLALAGVLAVAAFIRDPGVLLGSGTLRGGGLLPAPGALDLMRDYLSSWQEARFGSGAPMPAYLPLLAAASLVTLGSVDLLLRLAFGLAVPLAFLSCYLSLGGQVPGRHRVLMSLGYAWLPAGAAAMGGGRLSTVALLLLAPPTARLVVQAFTRAHAGAPGIRAALAAGTMLGVVAAFAPLVYVVAVIGALAGWLGLRLVRWPVRTGLVILGVAGVFLVLWAGRLVSAPWLVLSEMGVNDPALGLPAASVWGLAPGGPTSVPWAGLPLLLLAGLALLVSRFADRGALLAAAAAALLAAAAWLTPLASTWWPDVPVGTLWPGVPLLLAGGLLVVLVAGAATRPGTAGRVLSVLWVACVAALAVAWWVSPTTVSVGTDNAIPPVVGLEAQSPARPRSLVLDRTDGRLRYAVANDAQVALGAADALAGRAVDPGFADAVAGLVSGASGDVELQLGGRAIRFVVFDGPADDPVVDELDATIGLRQLARSPDQSLWLVAGDPRRAELGGTDSVLPPWSGDPIEVPVTTDPTSIDVVVHPQAQLPRRLLVAEAADPGWEASISGVELRLTPDRQGMLQATLSIPGDLVVAHRSSWPFLALAQLVVIAGLVVLSLPKRRAVDPEVAGERP